MPDDAPRWRRRKTARPGEILEAALSVFAEQGFAAARLAEIARRAGVSKAALYLYFETKEDLFRAAARALVAPDLTAIAAALEATDAPFAEIAPLLMARAAELLAEGRGTAVAKMVIGESRNFPDLARIWHDDVVEQVLALLTGLTARAQARGEVIDGDPRLFAFSLMGPLVMGGLFHAVFGDVSTHAPDLRALAAQHARVALHGLLAPTFDQEPIP
jgi:AcrR family transcriptional regulator